MNSHSRLLGVLALSSLLPIGGMAFSSSALRGARSGILETPVQVTDFGATHPSVSQSGDRIAIQLLGGGIATVKTDGTELDTLTTVGREADWRRQGNLIVFRDDSVIPNQITTVDAVTGEVQVVSNAGGFDDDPAWSPQGNEIALQSSSVSIAIVAYPGGELSLIPCFDPEDTACEGEGPTWSPDGASLAFEDGRDILKVARSGGTAEVVVTGLLDVTHPSWSPDGKWIAFSMDDSLNVNSHIWVADARGTEFGLFQLTDGTAEDFHASWSPDSQALFFDSNRSGRLEIWRVDFRPLVAARQTTWTWVKAAYR